MRALATVIKAVGKCTNTVSIEQTPTVVMISNREQDSLVVCRASFVVRRSQSVTMIDVEGENVAEERS